MAAQKVHIVFTNGQYFVFTVSGNTQVAGPFATWYEAIDAQRAYETSH
jgi:hypothetical protein